MWTSPPRLSFLFHYSEKGKKYQAIWADFRNLRGGKNADNPVDKISAKCGNVKKIFPAAFRLP